MVREAVCKMSDPAGDRSSAVLTAAVFNEGQQVTAVRVNPVEVTNSASPDEPIIGLCGAVDGATLPDDRLRTRKCSWKRHTVVCQ